MRHLLLIILLFVLPQQLVAQQKELVRGKIVDASDDKPMENVNIVNLNQVFGTATNQEGAFEIQAKVNDTLHLSFLGYKSIKVRVTNDWVNFGNQTTIKLTELIKIAEEAILKKQREDEAPPWSR